MAKHVKMLKKTKYKVKQGGNSLCLDLSRWEKKLQKAQFALDNAVMTSMVPLMPMDTGIFIHETRTISESLAGSGKVCAAAPPFGHFLYVGKTMVDEKTGSTYARHAAKKVYVSQYSGKTAAKEHLTYSNQKAQKEWFEVAKEKDMYQWVKTVQDSIDGAKG